MFLSWREDSGENSLNKIFQYDFVVKSVEKSAGDTKVGGYLPYTEG